MGAMKILHALHSIFRILYWYLEALYRKFVPPPMKSINGETILVTGATGGIGKEICKCIVKSGKNIKLVIWDLNLNYLEKLTEELRTYGGPDLKVFPFVVDISTRENIKAGCQQMKDSVGSATIIFNNAGISRVGTFLQLTDEDIENVISVNLMSHFWIIRQFLPEMVLKNHGRIVNICSMGGLKAGPHALPYYASKYAVNGYTEALKMELQLPHYQYDGIHFSTVYPYFVQTPLITSLAVNPALASGFQRFLNAEGVGRKIVDGMRREYEYIYLPPVTHLLILLDNLMPMKLRKHLEAQHLSSLYYKDPREQDRIVNVPFCPPALYGKVKNG